MHLSQAQRNIIIPKIIYLLNTVVQLFSFFFRVSVLNPWTKALNLHFDLFFYPVSYSSFFFSNIYILKFHYFCEWNENENSW